MKSKIEQFAKNNNMEVAQAYLLLMPIIGFTLFLVAIAIAFNGMYAIAAAVIVVAGYLFIKFLNSLKDSFKGLIELVFTKPASQN